MAILMRGLAIAVLALGACSPAPTGPAGATVAKAWIRTPPPGAPTAAGYAVVANTGGAPDRLLSVRSPVGSVMLHRTVVDGATMTMQHVDALALDSGQAQILQPGGYHLMFVGLKQPLAQGAHIPVVLKFERAGEVQADFVVGQQPPP